jgi:hypothetical protein
VRQIREVALNFAVAHRWGRSPRMLREFAIISITLRDLLTLSQIVATELDAKKIEVLKELLPDQSPVSRSAGMTDASWALARTLPQSQKINEKAIRLMWLPVPTDDHAKQMTYHIARRS